MNKIKINISLVISQDVTIIFQNLSILVAAGLEYKIFKKGRRLNKYFARYDSYNFETNFLYSPLVILYVSEQ